MVTSLLLWGLGLALIAGGLVLSAEQPPESQSLREYVRERAMVAGLAPALVEAVIDVESGWNASAISPEDSYGLMQVLCRPDGKGGCKNRFDIAGWPPKSADDLLHPKENIKFGLQILAWDVETYGQWKGVAVYNDWSARTAPADGPYPNQDYVDAVREQYQQRVGWPG